MGVAQSSEYTNDIVLFSKDVNIDLATPILDSDTNDNHSIESTYDGYNTETSYKVDDIFTSIGGKPLYNKSMLDKYNLSENDKNIVDIIMNNGYFQNYSWWVPKCDTFIDSDEYFNPDITSIIEDPTDSAMEYEKFCIEIHEMYPTKRNHFPGWELNYMKEQTPEFCMAAVKKNGLALRFVKNKTPEICIAAIKQNEEAICFVDNPTPELHLIAAEAKKYRLANINMSMIPKKFSVKKYRNYPILNLKKEQLFETYLELVLLRPSNLRYIKNKTFGICAAAYDRDRRSIAYIPPMFISNIKELIDNTARPEFKGFGIPKHTRIFLGLDNGDNSLINSNNL